MSNKPERTVPPKVDGELKKAKNTSCTMKIQEVFSFYALGEGFIGRFGLKNIYKNQKI